MRVAVDGFPLWVGSAGIGTYTRELLRALTLGGSLNEYLLADMGMTPSRAAVPRRASRAEWDAAMQQLNRRVPLHWKVVPYLFRKLIIPAAITRSRADIYFGTNYFGLFHKSFKTVITVHDMNHVHHPETTHSMMYRQLIKRLALHVHMAHAVFADSLATKRDVMTFLGTPAEKVHVVYCGVDESFRPVKNPQLLDALRRLYCLPTRFVLYVGTLEPRKNLPSLIAAFELLCKDAPADLGLVIVGAKGWRTAAISHVLDRSPWRDRIVVTGFVPKEHLPALYSMADVFALPSLYEGFGLPVAEAMACGTPVVTSNVSSLPEVTGDAALLVDPNSVEVIAAALARLLVDRELAESLRQRGLERVRQFTWERAARQVEQVFQQVCRPTPT